MVKFWSSSREGDSSHRGGSQQGFRVDLLEQVGRRQARSRRRESCPRAAERGLEIDTLNESLWRLAMQAESKLRLRQAVAERYERVRALLGVLGGRATA